VIEAKDNTHAPGAGLEQALAYAEALDIPFVFSSNGDAFVMHDRVGPGPKEVDVALDAFPSPAELWNRYRAWKGLDATAEKVVRFPFHDDGSGKAPLLPAQRHQRHHRGHRPRAARVLLVMATGTGKTYTAFQIIWRLWKAKAKETHPVSGRPQHPHRPDQDQRLQALRPWRP
jgi:type I restriction enzyme R subunit